MLVRYEPLSSPSWDFGALYSLPGAHLCACPAALIPFLVHHSQVCTENVDIARFWGTLIYPPKNLIITKPSDKWPALYYPEMSGFDLKKRTFGCPSSLDIDAKKSFFATSGSDVGKESGVAGVAQPPESIYSVCDATDRIDKRTPQVEAVTGRARVAEIPEGVNGYFPFPAPGADAPDAAAGAAAGADNIAPCVDVNTILGYATCNPSTVEEDAAFSRDAVTCNGVTERSPTLIDKCKPMSREGSSLRLEEVVRRHSHNPADFFNHVGFVEGRGENGALPEPCVRCSDIPLTMVTNPTGEDKKTLNGAYDKVINAKNGIKGIVFSKYTVRGSELDFPTDRSANPVPCYKLLFCHFLELVKAKLKDEYDGNCVNLRGGGRKVNRKRGRHPNLDSGGKDKERESEGSKPKRRGGGETVNPRFSKGRHQLIRNCCVGLHSIWAHPPSFFELLPSDAWRQSLRRTAVSLMGLDGCLHGGMSNAMRRTIYADRRYPRGE